jgi:uncharacterized membrane protein YphA (DoxX/SURF4 family)
MFIAGGVDAVRDPNGKVKAAEAVTQPLMDILPILPQDTARLVRLNGMVQVGAGVFLAIGRFRRLAALMLIGSIIPVTYAGHRFWEEVDDDVRAQQRVHFLKNLGLLGGLILAALDTEGAPSLGWRARRRTNAMTSAVGVGRAKTTGRVHEVSSQAAAVSRKARRRANKAAMKANQAAVRGSRRANKAVTDATRSGMTLAAPYVRQVNVGVHDAARAARESAEPYVSSRLQRAEELMTSAASHLPHR